MSENPIIREKKVRIFVVRDAEGRIVGRYRAHSRTQAKSFYVDEIDAQPATDGEIFNMAKTGVAIGGLPEEPELQGQQALLDNTGSNAHDPGMLIQNQDRVRGNDETE